MGTHDQGRAESEKVKKRLVFVYFVKNKYNILLHLDVKITSMYRLSFLQRI